MSDALCRLKANLPPQFAQDLFEVIKEYDFDIDRHMKTIHKMDRELACVEKEKAQLRADLSESRRLLDVSQECVLALRKELIAFQKDVEGAEKRDLSFAMACVRDVEGITVGGALEMQRDEIASLRRLLDEARAQKPYGYEIDWPLSDGGVDKILTTDADDIEVAHSNRMEMLPLYAAAPVPAQPAVPEAVAKDAARYRYLRDVKGASIGGNTYCKIGMGLDYAIDAALLSAADTEVKNG